MNRIKYLLIVTISILCIIITGTTYVTTLSYQKILRAGNDHFSFSVIGHTYSNPKSGSAGIYKPLHKALQVMGNDVGDFVLLTGDIAFDDKKEYYDSAFGEWNSLGIKYYLTPGNHDIAQGSNYENIRNTLNYHRSYYSFNYKNWHFLGLPFQN